MNRVKNKGLFDRVYEAVRQVPEGKVVTYGQLASIIGTKDARKIGWALHALRHTQGKPDVPCHRVVNKDGRLAPNFAFDGPDEQRRRLISEGVGFVDEMHVSLTKCQWHFARNPKH